MIPPISRRILGLSPLRPAYGLVCPSFCGAWLAVHGDQDGGRPLAKGPGIRKESLAGAGGDGGRFPYLHSLRHEALRQLCANSPADHCAGNSSSRASRNKDLSCKGSIAFCFFCLLPDYLFHYCDRDNRAFPEPDPVKPGPGIQYDNLQFIFQPHNPDHHDGVALVFVPVIIPIKTWYTRIQRQVKGRLLKEAIDGGRGGLRPAASYKNRSLSDEMSFPRGGNQFF